MFSSRVRIFAALIAAASMSAPTLAEESPSETASVETHTDAAIAFAKSLTADATSALTDETASAEQRLTNFQAVLADGLALETIGKFMLGSSRKEISDEQLARYNDIFPPYITKLYAEQFEEIVGKPLEVIDAKALNSRDVIVRTEFERVDAAPINVDWRIRQLRSGDRKAIDIIVSGVSIMLVKREEFSAFITTNGVDALLDRLEAETNDEE